MWVYRALDHILNVIIDGTMSEESQNDAGRKAASLDSAAPQSTDSSIHQDASTNVSQSNIVQV